MNSVELCKGFTNEQIEITVTTKVFKDTLFLPFVNNLETSLYFFCPTDETNYFTNFSKPH